MKNQTSFIGLVDYIKAVEQKHAYGSETIWWGRFLNDVREQYPNLNPFNPTEDDKIDLDFYEWWASLYDIFDDIESLEDLTDEERQRLCDFDNDGDDWKNAAKEILDDHDNYDEDDN
jgi:hypothetical protein